MADRQQELPRAMRFLRILFWIFLALVLLLFSLRNWQDVTINLWGGLVMDVKKPALFVAFFLLGMAFSASRRAMKARRLRNDERKAVIAARDEQVVHAPATDPHPDEEEPF